MIEKIRCNIKQNGFMDRIETFKTITILSIALLAGCLVFHAKWLLWAAIILLIGATLETGITTSLANYWIIFAQVLGNINSKIIISMIFYIILTPFAVIYRLSHKTDVDRFFGRQRGSYFDDKRSTYDKGYFEKPW